MFCESSLNSINFFQLNQLFNLIGGSRRDKTAGGLSAASPRPDVEITVLHKRHPSGLWAFRYNP